MSIDGTKRRVLYTVRIGRRCTARCKPPRSFASMNSIVEEEVDSCSARNFEHPRLYALNPKMLFVHGIFGVYGDVALMITWVMETRMHRTSPYVRYERNHMFSSFRI